MTAIIRSITVTTNPGSATSVTVNTPASGGGAAVTGDLLLAFHYNDFYNLSTMNTPTGGPGGWTQILAGTADAGAASGHIKPWWAVAATGGTQSVTFSESGSADEEKAGIVCVIGGADTTTPVDDAAAAFSATGVTTWTVGPVSPTSSDALLIAVWGAGSGANSDTFSGLTGGAMTEYAQFHDGAGDGIIGTETLTASGSTGTRSVTPASSTAFASSLVAVKAAAVTSGSLRGPIVAGGFAVQRATW
jgi:hypothetical protein